MIVKRHHNKVINTTINPNMTTEEQIMDIMKETIIGTCLRNNQLTAEKITTEEINNKSEDSMATATTIQ